VVRAFVRMRELLANNRRLASKINELEHRLETHDSAIQNLIDAIKELMAQRGRPAARSASGSRVEIVDAPGRAKARSHPTRGSARNVF
jgi:uncharacterized protein involved in exopolysaccharide biosynthesis